MKIIPFYLPQFHEIPENNEWWGKGFTEWTNVKNAKPLFNGHKQPKTPLNNNYYCLLNEDVLKWQIELARENNIFGFCFYHYWFNGHLLLEKPIEKYLANFNLDFPFCLCWANPDWTKIWAGKGSEVLIKQEYQDMNDFENHVQYLLRFFRDSRYIIEEGYPVFVIYSPEEIPNLSEMIAYLRKRVIEEGFPGIKLMYQYVVSPEKEKEIRKEFDYRIRFQPVHALHDIENTGKSGRLIKNLHKLNTFFSEVLKVNLSDYFLKVRKTPYDQVWNKIIEYNPIDRKDVACAFVNWDNTSRRGKSGRVITGSSPEKFKIYMSKLIKKVHEKYDNDYLFVTAWNEWSEGSYLEPDEENQYDYLHALRDSTMQYM